MGVGAVNRVGLTALFVTPVLLGWTGLCSAQTRDPWKKLHRPLHLPAVATGAACHVTGGKRLPGWVRNGSGPAFLMGVGNAPPGVIDISESQADAQGWRGQKTPWAVRRRYRGPVLIRGERIDEAGVVKFALGYGQHLSELRWPAGRSVISGGAYRWWASATLFRAPGCYAFQADGTSFSKVVVMRVSG
jgi:hypothetical protein